MKKALMLVSVAALAAMVGCQKTAEPDDKEVLSYILQAAMSGFSEAMSDTTPPGPAGTVDVSVDHYRFGTAGGYIHVVGDGSATFNFDSLNNFLSGYIGLELVEVINAFAYEDSSGSRWVVNGAPHVSYTAQFGLVPGTAFGFFSFGPQAHTTTSGAVRITGPNDYDHTAFISVTDNIGPDGMHGHVSGSCDGEQIDYYY